jgi:hypothetical protein
VNSQTVKNQALLLTIGPSLAITIVYLVFFHTSLQHSTKLELAKLRKLEAIEDRTKRDEEGARLASLREEVRKSNEQIEITKNNSTHFVAIRSRMCKELLQSSCPADSIAKAIEILERNKLNCVGSIPKQSQEAKASPLPEDLKPIAQLLNTQKSQLPIRMEIRISIQGSYPAMQNAIRALRVEQAELVIVSMEMLPCEGNATDRTWFLTVSI